MGDPQLNERKTNDEIDLITFFRYVGKAFTKFFQLIAGIFTSFFNLLLIFLLFIKRRFLWIALAAVAGFSFDLYFYLERGAIYHTSMTVRTNFGSSRPVYSYIDYINTLLKQEKSDELSRVFNLPQADIAKLKYFTIQPVDDELQKVDAFRNFLINRRRRTDIYLDTIIIGNIKYSDFKKQLTKYDYPLHTIGLYTNSEGISPGIQEGLIKGVYTNALLAEKNAYDSMVFREKFILNNSIAGLDSLKAAYSKRITASSADTGNSGKATGLLLMEGTVKTPELDLYDKLIFIKDQLVNLTEESVRKSEIVQIVSPLGKTGSQTSPLKWVLIKYTGFSVLAALIILLLIEIYSALNKVILSKKG